MQSEMRKKGADQAKQTYIWGVKKYRDGDLKEPAVILPRQSRDGITDFDILYYRGMCHIFDVGDYMQLWLTLRSL